MSGINEFINEKYFNPFIMLQWIFNILFPKKKQQPHKHLFYRKDVENTKIEPRCIGCGKTLTELKNELTK